MPTTTGVLKRTVVLVGMMGAGKSVIGRTLAARLDVELRDSDAVIVERARMSIAEIFATYGEEFFRDKEGQVIASLLDDTPCILSTGGGAWLSEGNRKTISAHAAVVWLKADLDLLWNRVKHRDTRPLLRTDDPRATLAEIYRARQPFYALAEYAVEVHPDWSIAQTTDAVMDRLAAAGVIEMER